MTRIEQSSKSILEKLRTILRHTFGKLSGVFLLASLAFVTGCVPQSPAPPAPQAMTAVTPRPVPTVISLASQTLAANEFEITVSDGSGGTLTARRSRRSTGNSPFISCKNGQGEEGKPQNGAAVMMTTTVYVTVTAQPQGNSSNVRVSARVHTEYDRLIPPNDVDCVSSGEIERRIIAAMPR